MSKTTVRPETREHGEGPTTVDVRGTSRRRMLGDSLRLLAAGLLVPHALGCGGETDFGTSPTSQPRQSPTTTTAALDELRAGNVRYTTNTPIVRSTADIEHVWTETAMGQAPFATILGCGDSRLAPELIFDQFLGDVFVVREAGNIAGSPSNLGSLEYAQAVLGSKVLVVLGHSSCGAVKAAFDGDNPGGNMQAFVDRIRPGIVGATTLDDAIVANVKATIAQIRADSPLLRQAEVDGKIQIVGATYQLTNGQVTFMPTEVTAPNPAVGR